MLSSPVVTLDAAQSRHEAGFAHHYVFELLFDEAPREIEQTLRLRAPHLELLRDREELLAHVDGQSLRISAATPVDRERLGAAVEQSWNWRGARDAAPSCRFAIEVSDMVDDLIDPRERVRHLRSALATLIDALAPRAVHSVPSQQLFDAADLAAAFGENPGDELFGFVNVRFFKVEGHERGITADYDETVMDTLGLGAIGVHDLQCQFKMLDAARIGQFLYATAYYVYENGPVIENGHSIRGITADSKWSCRFEDSVAEPKRVVLDVDPGKPYAAGVRETQ